MSKHRQYGSKILTLKKNTQYCFYCEKPLNEHNKTIDHIVPIKYNGSNHASNLVICCKKCNSFKGGNTISELIEQLHKRLKFADESDKEKLEKLIKHWEGIKIKIRRVKSI